MELFHFSFSLTNGHVLHLQSVCIMLLYMIAGAWTHPLIDKEHSFICTSFHKTTSKFCLSQTARRISSNKLIFAIKLDFVNFHRELCFLYEARFIERISHQSIIFIFRWSQVQFQKHQVQFQNSEFLILYQILLNGAA